MMLRNPDHVTIAVADAAAAIEFFALLGFRKEHVTTIDGGEPAVYMGTPDMKAQHITLALEGADPRFEIQLLEFEPTPGADPGEHPTNLRRRGYNHLAFRVDDIEAVTAHLVERQAHQRLNTSQIDPPSLQRIFVIQLHSRPVLYWQLTR